MHRTFCGFLSLVFCCLAALAQQSTQPASSTSQPHPLSGLERYRNSRIAVFMNDFGELSRYRDANAALKPTAPGENRVVFFGDSITDM